jgi:radical SAM/Cys-rich protein
MNPPLKSLRVRGSALASPQVQLDRLDSLPLVGGEFPDRLAAAGCVLKRKQLSIFQINLGKLCNMTCRHCHVDAGPDRHAEMMRPEVVDQCLQAIAQLGVRSVDLTGGAPELHGDFRRIVEFCSERGIAVMDRCNLSVLLLPKMADLGTFLAHHGVEVVASLPHFRARNTDAQRGDGAFEKSIAGIRLLNDLGYGKGDPRLRLTLVHNPAGTFLPGDQAGLEAQYKAALAREHGVTFDRLIALNNMPISRYLEFLEEKGTLLEYLQMLADRFNPAAVAGLMCRDTLSIAYDGRVFDCDFNQMLDLPIPNASGDPLRVDGLLSHPVPESPITVRRHCFGCTAGSGSSCGGATA